jgi:hypothetical protein
MRADDNAAREAGSGAVSLNGAGVPTIGTYHMEDDCDV